MHRMKAADGCAVFATMKGADYRPDAEGVFAISDEDLAEAVVRGLKPLRADLPDDALAEGEVLTIGAKVAESGASAG